MKRSNRLILIMGVFLAAVAFVGILALGGRPTQAADQQVPMSTVVVARAVMAPGTVVTAEAIATQEVPLTEAPVDAYRNPADVVGSVVRRSVGEGQAFRLTDFQAQELTSAADVVKNLKPGKRAVAVQVDAVTGVGTLVQTGDRVDVVIAVTDTDEKFPVIASKDELAPYANADEPNDALLNNTSVKVLVQNAEVLGTIRQEPKEGAALGQAGAAANTAAGALAPTQVVIIAVSPQEVELVRFGQLDGNLSLVLRATGDNAGAAVDTTGITLRQLVDQHGVLPPRTVQIPVP